MYRTQLTAEQRYFKKNSSAQLTLNCAESLEGMHTTQIVSRHTTIPPVYINYNNRNNTNYNCALNHTKCTNVTECKTTLIMRSLLCALPYGAPECYIVHNCFESTWRFCFHVCVDYGQTHTTNPVTCARKPFSTRTILLASLKKLLTSYQDYLNISYL